MFNPRSLRRTERKRVDDSNKTVNPHALRGSRHKIWGTVNLNKTPEMSENNANSSYISQDPSHLMYYVKPDANEVSSIISSDDVIAAKVFLGSKSVYEKQYFEFNKRLSCFIEKIRNRRFSRGNLLEATSNFNPRKITQYSAKDNPTIEVFGDSFRASFQKFIHWDIVSKNLRNEINLNHYTIPKSYPQIMENISQHNNIQNLDNVTSSDHFAERTPFSSFENSDRKKDLNLLCIFTENNFYDNNSNLKQSWFNEDIKLVLPMTWNVVVACNVITITDENSQNIRLIFKNPLNTKVDYEDSVSPSTNALSKLLTPHETFSTMESGDVSKNYINENFQKRNENFSSKKSFVIPKNNKTRSETSIQRKHFYGRTNVTKYTVRNKINPFHLADPLLLNYSNGKEQKQILLYKDHSVRSKGLKGSDRNLCKTIENLLAKSVSYEGPCINLIFDPLQVIQQIRGEQKIDQKLLQSSGAKYDPTSHSKSSGDHSVDQNQWSVVKEKSIFATIETLSNDTSFVKLMKKISKTSVIPINTQFYQDSNVSKAERHPASDVNSGKLPFKKTRREAKPNVHIRLKRKSRTDYKRVNARKIVESVFQHFFHFYSLLGGQLKSGVVITKSNSNYWLKVSGLVNDSNSLKQAEELFTATAGRKVVLNIYDYLKFLSAFARNRRLIVAELVKQMMVCELATIFPIKKEPSSLTTLRNYPVKVASSYIRKNRLERSQSLPTIKMI